MNQREYRICTNCVMDTSDSLIRFDENGMCDHCHNYYESILPGWQHGMNSAAELEKILSVTKDYGKDKTFDCLMGISGGLDSSYLAYTAVKKWGLRPKFISIDTHWNLPVADENIQKITEGLGVEIERITVDWPEQKDLHKAFLKSGVPYQDNPQDLAIFAAFYNYAEENNFRYILNGGNHSTECIRAPVEWTHFNDMAQLRDIHRQFGTVPLKNYPLLGFFKKNLYYRYIKRIHIIKALDLIPYNKQEAIETLGREISYTPYQHKHYENRFTRFYEGYWLYNKFGFDHRRNHYSSLIVTKQISRDEVLEMLRNPPYDETLAMEDMDFICEELEMSKDEFLRLMQQPNKTWQDYRSNKTVIEFAIMMGRLFRMEKRNYR